MSVASLIVNIFLLLGGNCKNLKQVFIYYNETSVITGRLWHIIIFLKYIYTFNGETSTLLVK